MVVSAAADGLPADYKAMRASADAIVRSGSPSESRLRDLEELGKRIVAAWRPVDTEVWARTLLYLVGKLDSYDFRTPRKHAVVQSFSLEVLVKRSDVLERTECKAVSRVWRLIDDRGLPLTGERRSATRQRFLSLWLHAWNRLETAIDPAWDPNARFTPWPHVPGVPQAASPETIQDPALRKRYENALAEHRARLQAHNRQRGLRQTAKRFRLSAVRVLRRMLEADVDGFEVVLTTEVRDPDIRRQIREHMGLQKVDGPAD